MSAFAEIVVEGFVSLLRSLTGAAEEAASESPELQKKIRQAKRKVEKLASKKTNSSANLSNLNQDETESINIEEFRQRRNAKLLPQIKHVARKPEADRRFDWYEKHGFIEQCLRQREERLRDDEG